MTTTKAIILTLCSVILISCSTTRIVHIKPVRMHLQTTKPPERIKMRVHKNYEKIYKAYIDKLMDQIAFHNEQVEKYNRIIEKEEEGLKKS